MIALIVPLRSYIGEVTTSEEQPRAFSLVCLMYGMASSIVPLMSGFSGGAVSSMPFAFLPSIMTAAVAILIFAVLWFYLPETPAYIARSSYGQQKATQQHEVVTCATTPTVGGSVTSLATNTTADIDNTSCHIHSHRHDASKLSHTSLGLQCSSSRFEYHPHPISILVSIPISILVPISPSPSPSPSSSPSQSQCRY